MHTYVVTTLPVVEYCSVESGGHHTAHVLPVAVNGRAFVCDGLSGTNNGQHIIIRLVDSFTATAISVSIITGVCIP